MVTQHEHLGALFDHAWLEHGPNEYLGTLTGDHYGFITYDTFAEMVRRAQTALNVGPGDVVAVIANNSVEWAVFTFASLCSGAAVCPMYEAQRPDDWRFILEDSGATFVVCATQTIAKELPDLPTIVLYGEGNSLGDVWERRQAEKTADIDPAQLAFLLYTSGTTAEPKGVPLTHANITATLNHTVPFFDLKSSDRSLSFLPWAHSFGLIAELFTMTSIAASIALAQSVATIIPNLAIAKPTVLFSVPRVFTQFYNAMQKKAIAEGPMAKRLFDKALTRDERKSIFTAARHALIDKRVIGRVREKLGGRLRAAFSGGAALSVEVAKFMERLEVEVYEGYGLTETAALVSCNRPEEVRVGSVGKPVPGVDIRLGIVDDQPKGVGEVEVLGANVMAHYHNDLDPECFTDDGYFRTGDLGRFDRDGFLWIVGRRKEQYKLTTGKYVVPAPIEEVLAESPLVQHVVLIGENQPYTVAFVTADPDYEDRVRDPEFGIAVMASFDELSSGFKAFEVPRKVVVLENRFTAENGLLTPSGKPKRRAVLATYADRIAEAFAQKT